MKWEKASAWLAAFILKSLRTQTGCERLRGEVKREVIGSATDEAAKAFGVPADNQREEHSQFSKKRPNCCALTDANMGYWHNRNGRQHALTRRLPNFDICGCNPRQLRRLKKCVLELAIKLLQGESQTITVALLCL